MFNKPSESTSTVKGCERCICPPKHVKNMKELNRDLFRKVVDIPFVVTETENLSEVVKLLKSYFLKIPYFTSLQKIQDDNSKSKHKIYLNPDMFDDKIENIIKNLQNSGSLSVIENNNAMSYEKLELTYKNFTYSAIFNSIFCDASLSSFSSIGHIVHLNLRQHLLPYKKLIGQVILDKIKNCRLVVNKINIIDTKFRNFKMEILAQDYEDPPVTTEVTTIESDIIFKFDFAKVFWNPRLSTERMRVINKLQRKIDVVYDVFAGVGPFAITAAKTSKCRVIANDLNPDSYRWMCENVKINKVDHLIECCNMDGRDFIRTKIKNDLEKQIENFEGNDINRRFHVIMNLPELAFEFLNEFNGLLSSIKENNKFEVQELTIHCYCFIKNKIEKENIMKSASSNIGHQLDKENIDEIFEVRKVAPNKLMYRLSFRLHKDILYGKKMNNKIVKSDENELEKIQTNEHKRIKI